MRRAEPDSCFVLIRDDVPLQRQMRGRPAKKPEQSAGPGGPGSEGRQVVATGNDDGMAVPLRSALESTNPSD